MASPGNQHCANYIGTLFRAGYKGGRGHRCFDFTLKFGTFVVPGLVLPGHGTAWHKSGTSREIRDGWQH